MTILEVEFSTPVKPRTVSAGEIVADLIEDGRAVHDGGFEAKHELAAIGFVAETGELVRDGALVGGDHVQVAREGGADVIDGGLAGDGIERGEFDGDVGMGSIEESTD